MDRAARASGPDTRLTAVFSKRPVAGRVKTRLTPPLVPEQAALLAEGMLCDALERCAASAAFRTALVFAPAEDEPWFRARFPTLADQRPQRGDGLGERLASFFEEALGRADTRTVVVIGSDQPLVGTRLIARAHELLEGGRDLVLGPDHGGGYYLVGLRRPCPELFTTITMSSAAMCAATLALARAWGLQAELLEPGLDVDAAADLERLRRDLRALSPRAPEFPRHTARSLQRLSSGPADARAGHPDGLPPLRLP